MTAEERFREAPTIPALLEAPGITAEANGISTTRFLWQMADWPRPGGLDSLCIVVGRMGLHGSRTEPFNTGRINDRIRANSGLWWPADLYQSKLAGHRPTWRAAPGLVQGHGTACRLVANRDGC